MLMRFDPFRELDRLTQQVMGQSGQSSMPMDAYRHDDRFVVHFDLPGVDPSTVDLSIDKNVLTVTAERRWETEGRQVLASERPQGTFTRQLFLGETLDVDRVEASYDRGVLTLTIPVSEQAKPRKIQVNSGQGNGAAIEAKSTAA